MAFAPHVPGRAIIRPHGGRLMGRMQFAPTPGTWPNFAAVPHVLGIRIEKESGHTLE